MAWLTDLVEQIKDAAGRAQARSELDSTTFGESDDIIDNAHIFMSNFEDFYPRYRQACAALGMPDSGSGKPIDPASLKARADEMRGVSFNDFWTDNATMQDCGKAVAQSIEELDRAWARHTLGWVGDAANAAHAFRSRMDAASVRLRTSVHDSLELMFACEDGVQRLIKQFADAMVDLYGDGKMADLTPEDVDDLIEAVNELPGVIEQLEAKLRELEDRSFWEKAWDAVSSFLSGLFSGGFVKALVNAARKIGIAIASEITENNIREEIEKLKRVLASSRDKLMSFCQWYRAAAGAVHESADLIVDAVRDVYEVLTSELGADVAENPFAELQLSDLGGDGDGHRRPGEHGRPGGGGGAGPGQLPADDSVVYPEGDSGTTDRKGDAKVTVSDPDEHGRRQVTIDDGKGGVRTFDIDHGYDGQVALDAHGPDGTGQIRIEDGDRTIVIEQPLGRGGATVVTEIDANGERTSFLVGEAAAKDDFNARLTEDERRLTEARQAMEARGDAVSKAEWAELEAAEDRFRDRGGSFDWEQAEDHAADKQERSPVPESAFDEGKGFGRPEGAPPSAFDEGPRGGSGGIGASAAGAGGAGSAGSAGPSISPGAQSGAMSPTAGVGSAPAGTAPASAAGGGTSGGRAGMGGMMGGGMGAGGGGGQNESKSSQGLVKGEKLFEPDIKDGRFGTARLVDEIPEQSPSE